MKHLTLIRHAKSSHDNPALDDFDRPLNERGWNDARAMARHLLEAGTFRPDYYLTSPALRALSTAQVIAKEMGISPADLHHAPGIYEAPVSRLAAALRALPDHAQNVVLFGHNPGIENLTNWLCGTVAVQGVVTMAVVSLELRITSWQDVLPGCATLQSYTYPALIGAGKKR